MGLLFWRKKKIVQEVRSGVSKAGTPTAYRSVLRPASTEVIRQEILETGHKVIYSQGRG